MIEASIIIPTFNRAGKLRSCLQALCRQAQPVNDFEVIVVVDGSTDETVEMLAGLQVSYTLRVIQQPNSGQPTALNRGAAEAIGAICVFLDDDIIVAPQFLAEHLRLHEKHDLVVGIGQMTITLPSGADWFARGFAQGWTDHYAQLNRGERLPDWDDCYGGNMSVARAAFLGVGGNVTDLRRGYDFELAYRLQQYGCSFIYLPEALGAQYESKGFHELSVDAELAGEESVELARRHPSTETKLFADFQQIPLKWILLWNLFQSFHLSVRTLERWRRFAGKQSETMTWAHFLYMYSFWKGVRRAAPNVGAWKEFVQLKKRGNLA